MNCRLNDDKLKRAWQLIDRWVADDKSPAAAASVGTGAGEHRTYAAGKLSPQAKETLPDDAIFLIASPTKPLTALAIMALAERGELLLVDRIARYVSEFASAGKESITLAQCLTHTSGLPDMVPENLNLRRSHAPLDEFLQHVCQLTPDFPAGTQVQYQSTGFLMLAEVVQRVVGTSLAEFLKEQVFQPLGMRDTSLGTPPEWAQGHPSRSSRIATNRIPPQNSDEEWGWNSDYWRRLGAPWGGLLSTAPDLATFCRALLSIHRGEPGVIAPATLQAMTSNQLLSMPKIPEVDRRCKPWGYGWQLNWPNHSRTFGDFLSPAAYGHWGATGTMLWIDPPRDLYAVLLTTELLEDQCRRQTLFSNAVCGALE